MSKSKERYRVIDQREYGLVAPEHDSLDIERLITFGMRTCFGLSIHDRMQKAGMFAHLDLVNEQEPFIDQTTQFFEQLGSTSLTLKTVNFNADLFIPSISGEIRRSRMIFILKIISRFSSRRIMPDSPVWEDIGVQWCAVFDATSGLVPNNLRDLNLPQRLIDSTVQRAILLITPEGNLAPIPITCAYQPNLRVVSNRSRG